MDRRALVAQAPPRLHIGAPARRLAAHVVQREWLFLHQRRPLGRSSASGIVSMAGQYISRICNHEPAVKWWMVYVTEGRLTSGCSVARTVNCAKVN